MKLPELVAQLTALRYEDFDELDTAALQNAECELWNTLVAVESHLRARIEGYVSVIDDASQTLTGEQSRCLGQTPDGSATPKA